MTLVQEKAKSASRYISGTHLSSPKSPFLTHLVCNLPGFTAGNKDSKLNSFSNLTKIENKHQTIPKDSSCYSAEVEVVESQVKQSNANGKSASSISILTGYLWQLPNLGKLSKRIAGRTSEFFPWTQANAFNSQNKHTTINPEVCSGSEPVPTFNPQYQAGLDHGGAFKMPHPWQPSQWA